MAFDFACPDWFEKIQRGETPISDLPLDDEVAERAVRIFDNLRLPDVVGLPPLRDAGGDWQRDMIRAAFGSIDEETGVREVGEIFCLVPKKNSKTTTAAGMAITFLLLNRRPRADCLLIGPTQKISDTCFQQVSGMIEADPEGYLQKRFHVKAHLKEVVDRKTGARLMVRTFGMDVLTGAKPVFTIVDEIHLLGSVAYAADVFRQIRGGMLPFPESLLVMITTQSDHPPAGLFKSELAYARGVRDGRIVDGVRLLPVLYEFPEEIQTSDDRLWLDPELWWMVTPNLGLSITIEGLQDGLTRAREDGDEEVIAWATQHLNVEVGMALHVDRWLGADFWAVAREDDLRLEEILDTSDVVTLGIDGGGLDDLLGLGLIGRHRETRQWRSWGRAWAHPIVFERRKEVAPRLKDFRDSGDLIVCESATQDIEEVADLCERVMQLGLLPEAGGIGLDPYGVAALVDELDARGIPEGVAVGIGQGSRLSPAVWGLERKLKDGTMVHCASPLMDWCVSNAKAEQRGNAILITKQTAGKAKIDPLIALFNAAMLMSRNPEATRMNLDAFLSNPVKVT